MKAESVAGGDFVLFGFQESVMRSYCVALLIEGGRLSIMGLKKRSNLFSCI